MYYFHLLCKFTKKRIYKELFLVFYINCLKKTNFFSKKKESELGSDSFCHIDYCVLLVLALQVSIKLLG